MKSSTEGAQLFTRAGSKLEVSVNSIHKKKKKEGPNQKVHCGIEDKPLLHCWHSECTRATLAASKFNVQRVLIMEAPPPKPFTITVSLNPQNHPQKQCP